MQPVVPIDVDETTGIWRTDGLPMVYLPRHFLVNNHLAVEAALGREAYRASLRQSTAKSAIEWCEAQVRGKGLDAQATFRHYFQRLSQRGIGIILISDDLPELLQNCDRILVMRHGRIIQEFRGENATEHALAVAAR